MKQNKFWVNISFVYFQKHALQVDKIIGNLEIIILIFRYITHFHSFLSLTCLVLLYV